jgi:hypothetical protein
MISAYARRRMGPALAPQITPSETATGGFDVTLFLGRGENAASFAYALRLVRIVPTLTPAASVIEGMPE